MPFCPQSAIVGAKMAEREVPHPEYKESVEIKTSLEQVVKLSGEDILSFSDSIYDEPVVHGHETSTVDRFARSRIEHYLSLYLPKLEGVRRYELSPYEMTLIRDDDEENRASKYYLIIDELDGTTNTKRALASRFSFRPQASVSIGLSLTEKLGDLTVSAVYDIARQETFSSIKIGDNFASFVGDILIQPKQVEEIRGDSEPRILVIGYSNRKRLEKGQLEDALVQNGKFRVYDGCRSSSVDVLNVIRGLYDAYIDPRAIWGRESGAVLEAYDIAGVIPIALGSGLLASDLNGESWEAYGGRDAIPLVIARPAINGKILEIVAPLTQQMRAS